MKHYFFIFILILGTFSRISAQDTESSTEKSKENSKRRFSLPKKKIKRAPIELYKIITPERDTTFLDTTLTIHKDYKFNYLRSDDFELVPFVNVGSPYLQLAKQENYYRSYPSFGAKVASLAFIEREEVTYHSSPTPLTDLYYKNALEQGQQLHSFISVNTAPNLNFTINYNGIRSLGNYRSELTSTTAFKSTLSYHTRNNRFFTNIHYVQQKNENQENAGLTEQGAEDFKSGDEDFTNRSTLEVGFQDGISRVNGKRFFIENEYRILRKDSLQKNRLSVMHKFLNGEKEFRFIQQTAAEQVFGRAVNTESFEDKNTQEIKENSLGFRYENTRLGELEFLAKHNFFEYRYNSVFIKTDTEGNTLPNGLIPNQISDNSYGFTGGYRNTYKGFLINGKVASVITGKYANQYISAKAGYDIPNQGVAFEFGYKLASEAPQINKLLNQSNFFEYNWVNNFSNTVTNSLIGKLKSERFFDAELSISNINNYTYFSRRVPTKPLTSNIIDGQRVNLSDLRVSTPLQASKGIQLIKLKLFKEFVYKRFKLANTVMYQQVGENTGNLVYNVPQFVTRNTLYYENELFKKALFFQTGINFKYFTSYFADGYDPLIGENYTQNSQKFGGYPMLDVFFNIKLRQTRIFVKVENAQHIFEQNTTMLAPGEPSRDFVVRMGLVWNFFL